MIYTQNRKGNIWKYSLLCVGSFLWNSVFRGFFLNIFLFDFCLDDCILYYYYYLCLKHNKTASLCMFVNTLRFCMFNKHSLTKISSGLSVGKIPSPNKPESRTNQVRIRLQTRYEPGTNQVRTRYEPGYKPGTNQATNQVRTRYEYRNKGCPTKIIYLHLFLL